MSLPESNPYQFIPFPKQVPRYAIPASAGHDRQGANLFSGRLECTIRQETPIMALTRGGEEPPEALPSSSLRGMIRSVAEIAGQGCGSFIDLEIEDKKGQGRGLPQKVHRIRGSRFPNNAVNLPCHDFNRPVLEAAGDGPPDFGLLRVCRACALFGFAFDQASWRGRVCFSHADCKGAFQRYDPTAYAEPEIKLRTPMPHHQDFYFAAGTYGLGQGVLQDDGAILLEGGVLAGRKVYQHHKKPGRVIPDKVTAWLADTLQTFRFDVAFENLMVSELGLLIFALDLDRPKSDMRLRHNYGYAKPAGFGTVQITVKLLLQSLNATQEWYASYDADEGLKQAKPDKLKEEFFKRRASTDADWLALEKWLAWPQARSVRYPTQAELRGGRR
jgi:RAMP superfamily